MQTWTLLQRPEWQQSGVPAGKGSWVVHPSHKWDFKSQFRGLLLIIPGFKPVSSSVCLQKCSSGFYFYNASCFTVWIIRLLRPWGLARALGSQELQDPLLSLSKVLLHLLCLQAGTEPWQCPGRSEAGQRPALLLWSLNETFSILTSLTAWSHGEPWSLNDTPVQSVQSLSHVQLFMAPWTAAGQAPLSITNSQSLLKIMSI